MNACVISRWEAIKLAFIILWFASGTEKMRIRVSKNNIYLDGAATFTDD